MKIAHYIISGLMLAVLTWLVIAEVNRLNAVRKVEKEIAETPVVTTGE